MSNPTRKNHSWKYSCYGVSPGSGRPHGTIETWTCRRCGCQKSSGPESTHTGARVVRRRFLGAHGYPVERLSECTGAV